MNNVYLALFGTLLSALAIFVASTGGIWMSFTYLAFILSNAYTTFTVYERIQKDLPDEKESVLYTLCIMALNTILALYPFYFWHTGEYEGGIIVTLLVIATVFSLAFFTIDVFRIFSKYDLFLKAKEYEQMRELKLIQEANEKAKKEVNYQESRLQKAKEKYGTITKSIVLGKKAYTHKILVFAESKIIIILGKVLRFSDVLGCTINDEQTIEKGAMTATTTTNTGNMIGRAAVGGLLLGGTGAIIGGATAKKNTVINQENDVINHHYIVTISVKDLGAPYITIRTDNIDTANQILSLVNAVIASK